jgi:hypothetical protein
MFKQRPLPSRLTQWAFLAGLFGATFFFLYQAAAPALAMHDDFLLGEAPDVKGLGRDLPGEGSIARVALMQEQRQAIFALYLVPVLLGRSNLGKSDALSSAELVKRAGSAQALLDELSPNRKKQAKDHSIKGGPAGPVAGAAKGLAVAKGLAAPATGGLDPKLVDSIKFLQWRIQYLIGNKNEVVTQVKAYLARRNAEAVKHGALVCADLLALSLEFGRQGKHLDENNLLELSLCANGIKAAEMASQTERDAVNEYERHVAAAYSMAQLDRREEASEHFGQAINYLRPRPATQRPQTDALRKAMLRVVDEDLIKYESVESSERAESAENVQSSADIKKRAVLVLNESDRTQLKRNIDRLVDIAYLAKIDGRFSEAAYLFRRAFLLVERYLHSELKDYSGLCYDLGETLLWDEKYDDSVYYLSYCFDLRSKENPLAVIALDTNNLLGRARLLQGQAKKAQDIFLDNLVKVAKRAALKNCYVDPAVSTDPSSDAGVGLSTDIKAGVSTDVKAEVRIGASREALIQALLAYYPTGGANERRQIDDGLQGTIDAALPLKQYDVAIEGGEALLKLRNQAVPANDAGVTGVLWGLAYACDSCARPEQGAKYYSRMLDTYGATAPTSLANWYHGRGVDYDMLNKHDLAKADIKRAIVLYQKKLKAEEDQETHDHLYWTIADLQYNLKMANKYPPTRPDYANLPDNCHWRLASFPLKIFIDSGKKRGFGGELNSLVREAVAIWSDYEGSPIKVQYVDKLSQADVFIERVTVYDDIPYGSAGRTSATYERKGEAETKILTRAHVRIYCPTFDGSDWENQDVKMSSFAKIQFKCLLVHELGHVFGLGHSPAGPDIMFWKSCAQRLSNRDMNTVKIIYKHVGKSARGPNGRAG